MTDLARAIRVEEAILRELKHALKTELDSGRRGPFLSEHQRQINTQEFRVVALRRAVKGEQ